MNEILRNNRKSFYFTGNFENFSYPLGYTPVVVNGQRDNYCWERIKSQ